MTDEKSFKVKVIGDLRDRALGEFKENGGIDAFMDLTEKTRENGGMDFINEALAIAERDGAVIAELADGDVLIEYDEKIGFVISELP